MSLRRGKGGKAWGWGEAKKGRGGQRKGTEVYERGFKALEERMGERGTPPTRIWVVWGTKDDMVPLKGRQHLRRVLLDLVAEGDWVKLAGKGHDDILNLSCVMEPVFEEAQN